MNSVSPGQVKQRAVEPSAYQNLRGIGVDDLTARLLASRGVTSPADLTTELADLLPVESLKGAMELGEKLIICVAEGKRITVVCDFDADGATSGTIMVRGLRMLGGNVAYIVPDRIVHGYGLTPSIVDLAADRTQPDVIVTVDNGIASFEGIAAAHERGIRVFVTDHHLPSAQGIPAADAIVNPQQPGCSFESKNLAGCGVAYYVLLATRVAAMKAGMIQDVSEMPVESLLDVVALGTVADVVKLDRNNRILVENGLRLMREGSANLLIRELLSVCEIPPVEVSTRDLGFSIGPRINCAGRIANMSIAIDGLLSDDILVAAETARLLDATNKERRAIEAEMRESAAESIAAGVAVGHSTVTLFDPSYHEGVVGLLASRVKDALHLPAVVFAPSHDPKTGNPILKGSGRSVDGIHLRDVLDAVYKARPDLILRMGGHAMAAGLSIPANMLDTFRTEFDRATRLFASPEATRRFAVNDGACGANLNIDYAMGLATLPWGQGFPEPSFVDSFTVLSQSVVGGKHLKLLLQGPAGELSAICFNRTDPVASPATLHYKLSVQTWRGQTRLQLAVVEFVEDRSPSAKLADGSVPCSGETADLFASAPKLANYEAVTVAPRGARRAFR